MKAISIKINDEVNLSASQRISDLESDVNQRVTEFLESVSGGGDVVVARARMAELFASTKNFGVGLRPSREKMRERSRVL